MDNMKIVDYCKEDVDAASAHICWVVCDKGLFGHQLKDRSLIHLYIEQVYLFNEPDKMPGVSLIGVIDLEAIVDFAERYDIAYFVRKNVE